MRTNEKIYDLLVLGKSLPQTIDGDTKSFPLLYIDWNPETFLTNNVFHVTEEFEVERTASHETRRPDIVLFVNGIPLAVIECKRPDLKEPIERGHLPAPAEPAGRRDPQAVPLLATAAGRLEERGQVRHHRHGARSSGRSGRRTWTRTLAPLVNKPLEQRPEGPAVRRPLRLRARLLRAAGEASRARSRPRTGRCTRLCRPERLLDLTFNYTLFDAGEKKIARYQQFFCVKKILERIRQRDDEGRRKGGVVWHTQGSGKSLTMVMLAKAIAREDLPDYKIVLVTDRVDLDDQIYKTFRHCDMEPDQAKSGRHLAKLLEGAKSRVITTIIDKFETAVLQVRPPERERQHLRPGG